tara:strand:- start:529 stop:744 length:216 start_codon:yes stop_codon:yes gene_type:complete
MVIVTGAAGAGVPPVDPYARVTVRPVQDVDPSLPGTNSGVNLPYGGQRRTYTIAPSGKYCCYYYETGNYDC